MKEEDKYERNKEGEIIYLKSKKPKLKKMDKNDMLLALRNTADSWIVDGFSASSKKVPTGTKDLPDAYFILKTYLKNVDIK